MTVSAELGGAAASVLPLVFYDGNSETDLGTVAVDGTLRFRKFQTAISQKIGVQPGQISLTLVRRGAGGRKGGGKQHQPLTVADPRRKTPIDEGSDFAAIAREKDCFVLASLRRSSRRSRPHRGGRGHVDARSVVVADHHHGLLPDDPVKASSAPRAILRRPSSAMGYYNTGAGGVGDVLSTGNGVAAAYRLGMGGMGLWDLEADAVMRNLLQREHDLQMQRERYHFPAYDINPYVVGSRSVENYSPEPVAQGAGGRIHYVDGSEAEPESICAGCEAVGYEQDADAFHLCVRDPITYDFRSTAGPIRRPTPRELLDGRVHQAPATSMMMAAE